MKPTIGLASVVAILVACSASTSGGGGEPNGGGGSSSSGDTKTPPPAPTSHGGSSSSGTGAPPPSSPPTPPPPTTTDAGGSVNVGCTGPADCTGAVCCVRIETSQDPNAPANGTVACEATCPGSATLGASMKVTTRACHADADCAGYQATTPLGPAQWTTCCSRPGVSTHFCADPSTAVLGGYTCP